MELTFVVEFTDRRRAGGAFITDTAFVTVLADTDTEATLVAAQMAASTIPAGSMVTRTTITDIHP